MAGFWGVLPVIKSQMKIHICFATSLRNNLNNNLQIHYLNHLNEYFLINC